MWRRWIRGLPDDLDQGQQYMLFYRKDCEHCHELMEFFFAEELPLPTTAVAVPERAGYPTIGVQPFVCGPDADSPSFRRELTGFCRRPYSSNWRMGWWNVPPRSPRTTRSAWISTDMAGIDLLNRSWITSFGCPIA